MIMSEYLSTELIATCGALGYYDGTKYHLDKFSLDVIKDLIKYLKKDNDSHSVRQFLGRSKLLQTDLIKIFLDHCDKLSLWDVLLRLIINLTSPVLIFYNEQVPTEKTEYTIYMELISYTQAYKEALIDDRIWTVIGNRLGELLKIDSFERGEEKELIIERILVFIRNVLQIPPAEDEKCIDNNITIHDEVVFAINATGLIDLLLYIVSNSIEAQYHMQVLEIVSLMLRDQNARQLATSVLQCSTTEKERDEALLLAARQKEKLKKMEKVRKYASVRHSRFGGTYVVQNMKAIGDNQLLCHKPYQKIEEINFGQDTNTIRKPKNKRPMPDPRGERTSPLNVRLFLKEFCVEFLKAAYNPIMRYARSCVITGGRESFETHCFLWSLRFFMEFNRHYKNDVKYVSETISNEVFHLIQGKIEQYYEMILVDKKKIPIWSRRLHLALKAYQEMFHTLMAMDKSADSGVRESSKVIKSNVFYVPEYRETILSQLLYFDEVKMSRQYLVDLVKTAHIFLKMLANFCGKGQRNVVVQTMKRKRQKGKNKKKAIPEKPPTPSLEERWDDVGPELSVVMREGAIPEIAPFDATMDTPIDDQKSDAMKRIQKLLRTKHLEQAVGLIRAARDVWPENDSFGRVDMPPEEEFLALREIFFADLGVIEEDPVLENEANREEDIEISLNHFPELDDEEEDEESPQTTISESNFNFSEFVHRFANVKIVKALLILLEQFDKNTDEVNHYISKMLHRISWDCKMPGMMFQGSMFRVFQRILESKHPGHKDLQKFAIFIIRRFSEVVQKNRKAYMELLFWKSTQQANAVVEGYQTQADTVKVMRSVWTNEDEDELRTLFMEHQTNKYTQDLIDWILERINQDRTRRGIIKKLKELHLVVNSKEVRSDIQKRLPKEWAEDEIAQLEELWEQLKEDDDPVDLIFTGLRIKRPKPKIKEKLLELGLAKDRKELRKKRSRKSNHGKSSWETQSVSNSGEDGSTDEETGKSSGRNSTVPNKPTNKKSKKTTRKQATIIYTDAQLSGLLKNVIDENTGEALEWIKESLQEALDDRDEESSQGISIVPTTDYSSSAMDSPSFQKLLRALGISPPADEQESYWRIPANMLSSTIQKRCKLIEDALAGNFPVEETPPEPRGKAYDGDDNNSDSDDDVDVLENIRKYFSSKEPESFASCVVEPIASTSSEMEPRIKSKKFAKKGNELNDDSETTEEMEADSLQAVVSDELKKNKKPGGRVKKIFHDYSDSDAESDIVTKNNSDESKRNRSDSSDKENEVVKKRRLLESDEEEEPLMAEVSESQRVGKILSDDENEASQKQHYSQKSPRVIISDDED